MIVLYYICVSAVLASVSYYLGRQNKENSYMALVMALSLGVCFGMMLSIAALFEK